MPPVQNVASSEARNDTIAATSAGRPARPSGMRATSRSVRSESSVMARTNGVSVKPGTTMLARTPNWA